MLNIWDACSVSSVATQQSEFLQSFSYVWTSVPYPELQCSTGVPFAWQQPTGKCVLTPIALCQMMQTEAQDKLNGAGGEFRATLSIQKVKANNHESHELL